MSRIIFEKLPTAAVHQGPIQRKTEIAQGLVRRNPTLFGEESRMQSEAARSAIMRQIGNPVEREIPLSDLYEGYKERSFEFKGYTVDEAGNRNAVRASRRRIPEKGITIDTRAQGEMCGRANRLEDLREYEIAVYVSPEYQREQKVVIAYEMIFSEGEFIRRLGTDMAEVREKQADGGSFCFRIDGITNESTHEAVRILHNLVSDLIEAGANLVLISELIEYYRNYYLWQGQRVLPLDILQNDPKYEQLKPIITRYFPGIILETQPEMADPA